MQIAMIGFGNVGSSLAPLWLAAGHTVTVGVRSGGHTPNLPAAIRSTGIADAVRGAEIVTLAVPWQAVPSAIAEAGDLAGKILIDTSNPLLPDLSALALGTTTSAAEQVAALAPGARVVKAFNTLGAFLNGNAQFNGQQASGFLCGDDREAKEAVQPLVSAAGLDPIDVGPLRNARYLEAIAMLWIDLAVIQKFPADFAFTLLQRPHGDKP